MIFLSHYSNSFSELTFSSSIFIQINFTDDPTRSTNDTTNVRFHPSNQVNFTVGLGIEKQNRGKLFVHYYGTDVFAQFHKEDDDFINNNFGGVVVNLTSTSDRKVETLRAGINPFMGVKFYFNSQLSLGIETGFQVYYFYTKFTELRFETQFIDNQFVEVFIEDEPVNSKGIGILFNGARLITVGYAF